MKNNFNLQLLFIILIIFINLFIIFYKYKYENFYGISYSKTPYVGNKLYGSYDKRSVWSRW
jgi:hypothetical protein